MKKSLVSFSKGHVLLQLNSNTALTLPC